MRTELEVFGLISIGELSAEERAKLDPSDFFGHEEDVKAIQEDRVGAIRKIISREWPDLVWPENKLLKQATVNRFREICSRERALTQFELQSGKVAEAKKILTAHRMNGGLSRAVVEKAERVLIEAGEREAKCNLTTES